jgi:hypothetical protein
MPVALLLFGASGVAAQGDQPRMDVYGFVMLDMGYQAGQNHADWYDVVRPTKLPAYEDQYGKDGRWFSGVRQSRLGVKSYFPTELGELKTTFEFELFGVGPDAGQTTFRLRHAYGELGQFGAGQTWSPFMDIDVFPNSLEYWGPTGMVFFRNVQVRWMPIQGDTRATIALEKPGASADPGEVRSGLEDNRVQTRFPAPDVSGEFHFGQPWGYVEAAGIVRYIQWDDLNEDNDEDVSGDAIGWGINLSTNIKTGEMGTLRGQVVYGEAIQNYMNDAPVDLAAVATDDPLKPIDGEPLPVLGVVAFYDLNWNAKWSTSFGYSLIDIDNVEEAADETFDKGHYALVNLLHYPTKNLMVGIEGQYGKRENFGPAAGEPDSSDPWSVDDFRVQFSAKYNFSYELGGK